MAVVHLATTDIAGGAARAAYRQHEAVRAGGRVRSRMLVMTKLSRDPDVIPYDYARGPISQLVRRFAKVRLDAELRRACRARPGGYELFSDDRTEQGSGAFNQLPACDLVNLHWIDGFVPFHDVFRRFQRLGPVVWTLHDMAAFTGGCHYDAGCGRYRISCGGCPQLGSLVEGDLAQAVWRRKEAAMSRWGSNGLTVVCTSSWLKASAKASALFRDLDIRLIPHGIDSSRFTPGDRAEARRGIGLPAEAVVVVFMATGAQLPRKGYAYLHQALEALPRRADLVLLTVGGGRPASPAGLTHLHLERASTEDEVIAVYRAADLFVMPSVQEAYGLTGQEAMACGIPLVGFRSGMCVDAVVHGQNGLLVDVGDVVDLKAAIVTLIDDRALRERMGNAAREHVCAHLTYEDNAQRYYDLYAELLARRAGQADHARDY